MTNDRFALARVEAERLVRAGLTYEEIGVIIGVHPTTVRRWTVLSRWPRGAAPTLNPALRAAVRAATAGEPGSALALTSAMQREKRGERSSRPVERAQLIKRLYAAIESNLQDLEQRMNEDTVPSAADGERDARALNTAIRNLEKVTELETGAERDSDAARKRGGKLPGDDEHEASRLRRELAERILRLRQRHDGNA